MAPHPTKKVGGRFWTVLPLSGITTLPVWADAVEGFELYLD